MMRGNEGNEQQVGWGGEIKIGRNKEDIGQGKAGHEGV
jgi:hypothetical protein